MLKLNFFCLSGILFFLFSFLLPGSYSQIPLDSKLSVWETKYWTSPNGNFAFGFFNQSDQPNLYSASICFNFDTIPTQEQIIVWIAGADASVSWDSFIHLTPGGDLVLFDTAKGAAVWSSNTNHLSVASASLLDDGNLVLLNEGQSIVWQSFQTPSDTLLPGQSLSASQNLRAASRNCVSSYYSLSINGSGQLKLSWETNVTYWESGTVSRPIKGVVFTKDGALELIDERKRPVWSSLGEDHGDSAVKFRYLRLDVDGNLRMYSWVEASNSWKSVWQAVENQCHVFATCGLHGVCAFTSAGSTICRCSFGTADASNLKCLAPNQHSCGSGFTMIQLKHTFLYGMYPPNDIISKTSLEKCKDTCMQDPLCTSVTVTNDGTGECWTKRTTFVTGYEHPSVTAVSFVKACSGPFAVNPTKIPAKSPSSLLSPPIRKGHRFCLPCLIGGAAGTFFLFIAIQIGIGYCFFRRNFLLHKCSPMAYMGPNSRGLNSFSYAEVNDVSKNFSNQLGPSIYKGVLGNKQHVVVKVLSEEISIEEKQFMCAVSILGSIHHKNLMRLEGYCRERECRFLVYEYSKNGSVARWLEDPKLSKKLHWKKRNEICLSVARAVSYLHMGCREFINLGNLKWENVILDEEMRAKVTEFGLGRIISGRTSNDYGAAEEDVAKFGQMVVTIISGRDGGVDICTWVHEEWSGGQAERVVDVRMEGGWQPEELDRMLRIAFWCIQRDERLRPAMSEVVKVLEGTLAVDPPPSPFAKPRLPMAQVSSSGSDIEAN